jgi:hypothetical protein
MLKEAIQWLMGSLEPYRAVEEANEAYPSRVLAVNGAVKLESLERFQARPNRIQHQAVLDSSTAFVNYVNRFKGSQTSVYLDIVSEEPSFLAVIDHHGAGVPDWRDHRASFTPRVSLEWKAWTTLHERGPVSQQDLLAFFEDNLNDLFNPAPSVMLSHLQKFELVEKHVYQSAMNLDNGNIAVTYIKDGQPKKVEFPHSIQLRIPVLENEEGIHVDGRLRYKTSEGRISFTFQFKQNPSRILRDTLREQAQRIRDDLGEVEIYEGRVNERSDFRR